MWGLFSAFFYGILGYRKENVVFIVYFEVEELGVYDFKLNWCLNFK